MKVINRTGRQAFVARACIRASVRVRWFVRLLFSFGGSVRQITISQSFVGCLVRKCASSFILSFGH